MLESIFEFYTSASWHPYLMLLIVWVFWPGLFFLVGWVGESRVIPLGRGQSRMFFPGDLMLGVCLVDLIGMNANCPVIWEWPKAWWWPLICAAFALLVLYLVRTRFDAVYYPLRAANSPTKWTHDLVGWCFFPFILAYLGVPQLLALLLNPLSIVFTGAYWVIIALAIVFDVGCIVYDSKHDALFGGMDELMEFRHPQDWKPIWKK